MKTLNVLPDSRLRDANLNTVVADWPTPNGGTVRIECAPLYCVKCGRLGAYCPKDNTAGVTYICNRCYRDDPHVFDGMVVSDEQFVRDVGYEMVARFGRTLTDDELAAAAASGTLGPALEALERDSPYPCLNKRPKG